MITVYRGLYKVLLKIKDLIESRDYELIPELLIERERLINRIQELSPDINRLPETIEILSSIVREEKILMVVAKNKQIKLHREMLDFNKKRKAVLTYNSQSRYGV